MRGGYSEKLSELRGELLKICSLLELELDFSEEDVEFADRTTLRQTLETIGSQIESLKSSFALGNVLKNGINVAIVGEPNVGKSTLLNALVEDDRAMVSDIAGTTRDTIEATTTIDGIRYRFVDTAGIHTTDDKLEQMGIDRSFRAIANAHIILHLASAEQPEFANIEHSDEQYYIQVINKIDKLTSSEKLANNDRLYISAKSGIGIDNLRTHLRKITDTTHLSSGSIVVSNMRHYSALNRASEALADAREAMMMNISSELLSEDIRRIIHHLGEITGEITTTDILQTIFSKFCIGK
jgi:tRNA modification GTPase